MVLGQDEGVNDLAERDSLGLAFLSQPGVTCCNVLRQLCCSATSQDSCTHRRRDNESLPGKVGGKTPCADWTEGSEPKRGSTPPRGLRSSGPDDLITSAFLSFISQLEALLSSFSAYQSGSQISTLPHSRRQSRFLPDFDATLYRRGVVWHMLYSDVGSTSFTNRLAWRAGVD